MKNPAKPNLTSVRKKTVKLGLDGAGYVIWICTDSRKCKCVKADLMRESLKYLRRKAKRFRKDHGISVRVFSSECMDVCRGGPILAVMPDGVWYGGCDPQVIDQIFDKHLLRGDRVESHVIAVSSSPTDGRG
ncbi:MAG: hypothetical protein AAF664_03240 [Planctomycetota bacterium]